MLDENINNYNINSMFTPLIKEINFITFLLKNALNFNIFEV